MRRLAAALGAVALVAAACTTSSLDPDADVALTARVLDPAGAPTTARVVLSRLPNPADVIGGLSAGLLTLGVACTVEPEPRLCDEGNIRTTDADTQGRFRFDLTGRDTQDSFGFANEFVLTATLPATADEVGGARTDASMLVQRERLDLGDLTTWGARPSLASDKIHRALVNWEAAPPTMGTAPHLTFDDGSGGVLWARRALEAASDRFDARVLEATTGAVSVSVTSTIDGPGTSIDLERHGPRVGYRATGGVPASREAPCTVTEPGSTPIIRQPCPLTDGDLVTPAGVGETEAVRVDLAEPRAVDLLVVRGCTDVCVVSLSTDGVSFEEVATTASLHAALPFDPPRGLRAVQITAEGGGFVPSGLAEISVHVPDRPVTLAAVTPTTVDDAPSVLGSSGSGDERSRWPIALGVVLVLLAGAGVIVARGRAR